MGRKRLIDPHFFTHPGLYDAEAATGLPLRIAFAGLWCQADRDGRFRWEARVLKLHILPFDDVDFEAVLTALEQHGYVVRYQVDGRWYGVIPSFGRWQTFHKTERHSALPKPPDPLPSPSVNGALTVRPPLAPREVSGTYTAVTGTGTVAGTGSVTAETTSAPDGADGQADDAPPAPPVLRLAKPKPAKTAGAPWLGAIRKAHEARNGPGSFTPALAARFARSWGGIVAAVGEEAAAKTWHHAIRPTNPDLKFVTPERVAASYAQYDPDRMVAV